MKIENNTTNQEIAIGVAKGLFGTIPWVGSAINEAIFDVRARIKQNRFELFVNQIRDDLSNLTQESINRDFLNSEEFIDILEKAINKAIKSKHTEKIAIFSKIISTSIQKGEITDYDNELSFMDIIDNLTIHELVILKHLNSKQTNPIGLFNDIDEAEESIRNREEYHKKHTFEFESKFIDYSKEKISELIPNEARIAIEGLIAKSLAYDDSPSRIDTSPRTFIGLTPLGAKLIEFLIDKY